MLRGDDSRQGKTLLNLCPKTALVWQPHLKSSLPLHLRYPRIPPFFLSTNFTFSVILACPESQTTEKGIKNQGSYQKSIYQGLSFGRKNYQRTETDIVPTIRPVVIDVRQTTVDRVPTMETATAPEYIFKPFPSSSFAPFRVEKIS